MKHRLFYIFALAALASACADDVLHDGGSSADDGSNAIRIATLSTVADNLTVVESRASNLASGAKSNAEDLEWLREPLFSGFTIIYNKPTDTANERMALLQLNKDSEGNEPPLYKGTVSGAGGQNPNSYSGYGTDHRYHCGFSR